VDKWHKYIKGQAAMEFIILASVLIFMFMVVLAVISYHTSNINKKKEIEQNYSLTGIIFDKGKKQAVIQDRKGLSSFMYENDFLDEAKIISINETKSEVILDYKGKFTVVFRME